LKTTGFFLGIAILIPIRIVFVRLITIPKRKTCGEQFQVEVVAAKMLYPNIVFFFIKHAPLFNDKLRSSRQPVM